MDRVLNYCLSYLSGEKQACQGKSFYQLLKTASKGEVLNKTLEFGKRALPSFVGTGAALAGGGLVAKKVVDDKIEDTKEKAKKVTSGALAALGTAAALYGAHEYAKSKGNSGFVAGTKFGYKHGRKDALNSEDLAQTRFGNFAKAASEDVVKELETCFFLDELLKTAETVSTEASELRRLNGEMVDFIVHGILDKCAEEAEKKEEPKEEPAEGASAEEGEPGEEVPAEEGVPGEEVPEEEGVPGEEVPVEEGVPGEEVPAEEGMPADGSTGAMQPDVGGLTPEEEMQDGPANMAEAGMYAQDRLASGAAETDTQLAIIQEQQMLDQLNKHIQVSANNGQPPNPVIQAAALDRQGKINTLQNYMNSLMSAKTAMPPVGPDPFGQPQIAQPGVPMQDDIPMDQVAPGQMDMEQPPAEPPRPIK